MSPCPGCGHPDVEGAAGANPRLTASPSCWSAFGDLAASTLGTPDPSFVHQTAVDAYGAQHCPPAADRMLSFALLGLYLVLELDRTGAHVQQVHTRLARLRHPLPTLDVQPAWTAGTAAEVVGVVGSLGLKTAVHAWAERVWVAYEPQQERIREWSRTWPSAVWRA